MSTGRFLGGLLIGGALGAIIGLLVAPRSGEETRGMIRDEFNDQWNRSLENVRVRTAEWKEKARDSAEQLRNRGQHLVSDLEEAGRETWDKVRTTVKNTKNHTEESSS